MTWHGSPGINWLAFRLPQHVSGLLSHYCCLYVVVLKHSGPERITSACLSRVKKRKKKKYFQTLVESFECLPMTCTYQPRPHMFREAGSSPTPFTTCVLGNPSQRGFYKEDESLQFAVRISFTKKRLRNTDEKKKCFRSLAQTIRCVQIHY